MTVKSDGIWQLNVFRSLSGRRGIVNDMWQWILTHILGMYTSIRAVKDWAGAAL